MWAHINANSLLDPHTQSYPSQMAYHATGLTVPTCLHGHWSGRWSDPCQDSEITLSLVWRVKLPLSLSTVFYMQNHTKRLFPVNMRAHPPSHWMLGKHFTGEWFQHVGKYIFALNDNHSQFLSWLVGISQTVNMFTINIPISASVHCSWPQHQLHSAVVCVAFKWHVAELIFTLSIASRFFNFYVCKPLVSHTPVTILC